ncbi:annexin A4 [Strongylocentrotus purpuratus]|uniref:Annexin n=1 Tax=Strongylocentrotus purpuratus TaxID=7668 RepID=A0A7M7RHS1_STRPU|nr:annexin A4 [Strongylocentrotus purpuratus]
MSAQRPTVVPFPHFDKDVDSQALRKAMKGLGTDEKAIINIICYRTNAQRQEIKIHYKTAFGRDLLDDLKSELGGDFEDVILGLMDTPAMFDARCLKRAMKGAGTDEDAILEILCARTNAQIAEIKKAYKLGGFGSKDLEKDLKGETSGDLKRLLVGLSVGGRDEGAGVDPTKVQADAQALYEAGAAKWGTDESEFQRIIGGRSREHLRQVFAAYGSLTSKSIEDAIKSEMSGNVKTGYLNLVRFINDPIQYYVDKLHKAMKGLGTDEAVLVRVFVMRCEIDLGDIAHSYRAHHSKSLADAIKSEVGGDFRRALDALLS